MARSIEYWYQQVIAEKTRQTALNNIDSTSKVSVFGLLAYVFAAVAWVLDNLFDKHKTEVDGAIAIEKPHSRKWYRSRALAFQTGQAFNTETGSYDNTGLSAEDIEAQKIIAQAAVTEKSTDGSLRIKVARLVNDDLQELTDEQLTAFTDYMQKQKDAGVKIKCDSLPPDALLLVLDVFYDPLVLRSNGSRIDGTEQTPVQDAIDAYLKNLPFNGEYANTRLIDQLQQVPGVELPVIKTAQAKYGLFAFASIDERYIPDAGYLRIDEANLTINFREYVQY